jgi:hypothetical protein
METFVSEVKGVRESCVGAKLPSKSEALIPAASLATNYKVG